MATTQKQLDDGLKMTDVQTQDLGGDREAIAARANAVIAKPSGSITSKTLSGSTKPLTLPPPRPQTLTTSAQDYITSQNASIKTETQKQLELDKAKLDRDKNDITSLITDLGNSQGIKNDLYKSEGVDKAKKDVDEYTSQLEAEQHSNNRRIEALRKNTQGYAAGGMEQEINRVNSDSLTKQADLAILQNNALRRYSTAAEIADRAVEAKLEPMKAKLEALKFFYSENKADFDKKDDRAYAELIKKEERDYATQKENVTKAFSSGLRNKYINEGGKVYRASDGKEFSDPESFLADAGVSSFEEAYSKGLIGDLTFEQVANMNDILKLRSEYPDAGISITDDYQTAIDKLAFSNKYAKEVYNADAAGSSKPINIDGVDYFQDPETGEFIPASDFIVGGGTSSGQNKYISNNGQPLKLGIGETDTLSGFESTSVSADRALQLLMDGVKTGPVSSFDLSVNKKLGTADDKSMELEQTLAQIKANFTKSLSGAAVSEQEVKRLSAFLPEFGDQESVIKSKLNTLKQEMETKKSIFLETKGARVNPNFGQVTTSDVPVSIAPGMPGLDFGGGTSGNQVKGISQKAQPLAYISTSDFKPVATKSGGQTFSPVVAKVFPPGSVGGQCGDFVRRVVTKFGATYPRLGDTLKSKVAAVTKYGTSLANAKIGSVIVTKENPTYGHVAYIVGKNASGWIVAESNYKQSNKVSYGRVIPFNSTKLVGVINPTRV